MEKSNGLHVLYKRLGETPNQCILRYKNDNPKFAHDTMTYAGRLDPMAEGLLLVLSGERLQEKEKYLNLRKTYKFKVLWGFVTDTFDVLGMITGSKDGVPEETDVMDYIAQSVGRINQSYPPYSSKPVSGKPLFKWAREGRLDQVQIPKHEVEIYNSKFISRETVNKVELLENISEKVNLVEGDFRQEETLKKWQEALKNNPNEEFKIDEIQLEVSSGFYIRQFVFDLGSKFDTNALTFHIQRTTIGEFDLSNTQVS